jgi:hypothetical protein
VSSIPRNAGTPQRVSLAASWSVSPRPFALLELRDAPLSLLDANVVPIQCTLGFLLAEQAVLSVPHSAGHSHLSRFYKRLSDGYLGVPLQGFDPPASPRSTRCVAASRFSRSFHGFCASSRSGRMFPSLRSQPARRRARLELPEGCPRLRIPPLVPRRRSVVASSKSVRSFRRHRTAEALLQLTCMRFLTSKSETVLPPEGPGDDSPSSVGTRMTQCRSRPMHVACQLIPHD